MPDVLLRIAVIQWTQDPTCALPAPDRQRLLAWLQTRTPLTALQRAWLKTHLLPWAQTRFTPEVVAKLMAQFPEEVPHGD